MSTLVRALMKTGLSKEEFRTIRTEIGKLPDIEAVILYGSRAKGTQKRGSDVDLALTGLNLSREDVVRLSYNLNQETYLPYHFDIMSLSDADEPVRDHIARVGISIYP